MSSAGWGAGLSALSQGIGSMEELMRQRKLDELKRQQEASLQVERVKESARQDAQLKLQQQQGQQQAEQFARVNAATNANQFGTNEALPPDVSQGLRDTNQAGMLRTVSPDQAHLASQPWQGDLYTKESIPAQVPGDFRRANPAERQQEDQQKEKRDQAAEAFRGRDREFQATLAQRASENELNRKAKETQDLRDLQGRKDVAGIAGAIRTTSAEGAASARETGRLDKSYELATKSLESLRKPLADQKDRFSRLEETINQATPQADALVAPELLTVMAGGQGSGLRMTEAEIARIVGGRSNFEGLKAAINKWQTDPSKALSITPSQRQQIRALMTTVSTKLTHKLGAIQQAGNELLDAPDVQSHRTIINTLRQQLDSEEGTTAPSPVNPMNLKPGDSFMGGTFLGWKTP